jgi:hypothetical protein
MSNRWFTTVCLAVMLAATVCIAESPTTSPSDAGASTPKGAAKLLQAAMDAGNKELVRSLLWTETPVEQRMADAMAEVSAAAAALRQASVSAFGTDNTNAVLGESALHAGAPIDAATETRQPDGSVTLTVTPTSPDAITEPMTLREKDGRWHIVIPHSLKPDDLDRVLADVSAKVEVFRKMADEIAAGKYRSMNEVASVLHGKLLQSGGPATQPTGEPVQAGLRDAAP